MLPYAPVDVLIADDDSRLRGSLRLLLQAQGFTCAEAADGVQTMAIARKLTPRCVLLDLGMPGLDGLSVARRLRSDRRTAHAHVHCLTGRADPASRRQAEEAGCELYLTKPVDPTAVVAAVRGWTGLTPRRPKTCSTGSKRTATCPLPSPMRKRRLRRSAAQAVRQRSANECQPRRRQPARPQYGAVGA